MIDINNISILYRVDDREIQALSSFSLHAGRGDYIAIMGPNGSGKSTLIKALCGLVRINDGQIRLFDKNIRLGGFGEDFFGKVGVVFQEPEGQFLMRDVETEIISVLQNLGLLNQLQKDRFTAIVEQFDLSGILHKKPEDLSGGQMQIVNLACALSTKPEILLLDEPTSYLDDYYRRMFLDHLDSLHKTGMTILHITQYSDEAERADRLCVLDNGRLVLDQSSQEALSNFDLLKRYDLSPPINLCFKKLFGFDLGNDVSAKAFCDKLKPEKITDKAYKNIKSRGDCILSLRDLKFQYPDSDFTIKIDDLKIARGEIVGFIGATGSGKSTLAFLMGGVIRPDSGTIEYDSRPLSSFKIKELRKKVGIAWQLSDLVMLGPTIKDDIEFTVKNLGLENADIAAILKRVGLDGFEDRIVDTLSGGEKRKLSLAGILAANPDFIILDEPTAFLDPRSQSELVGIIQELADEGRSIIIAGHNLQFISKLADRVLGIMGGRIIIDLQAADFYSNKSFSLSLDLPPDQMIAFRQILAEHGHSLPFGSLDPEQIIEYLKTNLPI